VIVEFYKVAWSLLIRLCRNKTKKNLENYANAKKSKIDISYVLYKHNGKHLLLIALYVELLIIVENIFKIIFEII